MSIVRYLISILQRRYDLEVEVKWLQFALIIKRYREFILKTDTAVAASVQDGNIRIRNKFPVLIVTVSGIHCYGLDDIIVIAEPLCGLAFALFLV